MEDIDRIRLIEKKRRNQKHFSKQQDFDSLYTEDSSFRAEVEDYNFIFDGLDMLHLDELEANYNKWEQKHKGKTTAKVVAFRKVYVYFAAAMIALLFSVSFLFNGFGTTDPLAGHFKVENFSSIAIVGGDVRTGDYTQTTTGKIKSDALLLFTQEKYDEAIVALNDYINNHKMDDLQAILVLSIAQLEQGDAASASRNLETVINAPRHTNQATAEWIMALAQYKLGNTDACKKFLNSIVGQKGHEYHKNAQDLLDELK